MCLPPRRSRATCIFDRVVAEVRHAQVAQQYSTVSVWIGAHSPLAFRRQLGQFRFQAARLVEYFAGLVAFQPAFQLPEMPGIRGRVCNWHLVRAKTSFNLQTIDKISRRPVQPLGLLSTINWASAWSEGCCSLVRASS